MKYEKIYIIGSGRVALRCQKIASEFFAKEAFFIKESDKKFLDYFFKELRNCLIISANNFYIFKAEAVRKNTIINYHNALLPEHRGVNAHLWTIWCGDHKTGITWHKIDESIDRGQILIQKEIKLDEKISSLELLRKQHQLAIDSFKECLINLQKQSFKNVGEGGGYHSREDLPNNGYLELIWEREKIIRFLRAYGAMSGVKKPKIKLFARDLDIIFYEFDEKNIVLKLENKNNLIIQKEMK